VISSVETLPSGAPGGGVHFNGAVGGFAEVTGGGEGVHGFLGGGFIGAVRTTVLAVVSQTALTPVTGATAVLTPVTHLPQQRWTSAKRDGRVGGGSSRCETRENEQGRKKTNGFHSRFLHLDLAGVYSEGIGMEIIKL